jgi:hypothetical protein
MTPAYSPSHRDDAPRAWFDSGSVSAWMAVTVGWKEYRRQVQARGYARAAPTRVPNGANLVANAVCPSAPTSATRPSPTGTPGRAYTNRLCPYPLAERDSLSRQRRCDAQSRDELAPPHSITSSALARSEGGMVSPSARAAFRLMASSNLVGCCTGSCAGFAPLRILST